MYFLQTFVAMVLVLTTTDTTAIGPSRDQVPGHAYHNITKREFSARSYGYGGCNDAFSVFGFLAFLLALLDLVMDMNNSMSNTGGGRRKRDILQFNETSICNEDLANQDEVREATLAAYVTFRAFLNALATEDSQCAQLFMCEGGYEAARLGAVGQAVASAAGANAAVWLHRAKKFSSSRIQIAAQDGAKLHSCPANYSPCPTDKIPHFYAYPGIRRTNASPVDDIRGTGYSDYVDFVQEAMNIIKSAAISAK